jgi:UDPglucose 6-dehydrogenase
MYPTLSYADSALEAAHQADVILHLTEWQEFRDLDPAVVAGHVRDLRVIDSRNALDAAKWRAAGWTYRALGRP